jgi:hypothetical protein
MDSGKLLCSNAANGSRRPVAAICDGAMTDLAQASRQLIVGFGPRGRIDRRPSL